MKGKRGGEVKESEEEMEEKKGKEKRENDLGRMKDGRGG